jgi:opacity protein-like surface antigen
MNKLFLTASFLFATILASAQFMVVTTIDQPEGDAEWEMSNITNNIGVGYMLDNGLTIGAVKSGEEFDLWARYNIKWGYVSMQMPTEDMVDNMSVGIGYPFKVWNELYVEPNYSMSLKEDANGEKEGNFKLGLSYRF